MKSLKHVIINETNLREVGDNKEANFREISDNK